MKKILLMSLMAVFAISLFAQNRSVAVSPEQAKKFTVTKTINPYVKDDVSVPMNLGNSSKGYITNPGSYIGSTYYESQSNACQHNKLVVHNDGTISAAWTTAARGNSASRGTGYNYFDGTQWQNNYSDIQRIESMRTGWGVIAPVGTDGEIVAAHYVSVPEGMLISVRPHKGTGEWTESFLYGPEVWDSTHTQSTRGLSWPDIATNGNTIHLIACTEQTKGYLYNGIRCALLYFRGTYDENTNTITWEDPKMVYDATPSMLSNFSGDRYTITAKGNTVAIVAPNPWTDLMIWKSTDNGQTFNTITVFDNPVADEMQNPTLVDTNNVNTIPNGLANVAIDDNGNVHLAFDLLTMHWANMGEADSYNYYPYMGCLTYWREGMPTYSGRTDLYPDTLKAHGVQVFENIDLDGNDTASFVKFDYWSDMEGALVSYPQLTCSGNNVYLIYNSILEHPFMSTMSQNYYDVIGVFGTRSTDGGQTWDNGTSWLSYNKQCYYINDWDNFSNETYEECLEIDGQSTFPTLAKNLYNGKLNMYWQEDAFPGVTTDMANVSYIFFLSLDADSLGIYNNTNEVHQNMWIDPMGIADNTLEGMKLYPNPATDNVKVAIVSSESAKASLTIFNIMGQIVYSENVALNEGENLLNVNTSNMNAGIYMVNVKTSKGTSTQKLIVR